MTTLRSLMRVFHQEDINFVLTNRVPRIALTRAMGAFSRIESPLLTRLSIAVWRLFTDLDLDDAATTRFTSLRACFTRALRPGARTVDARHEVLASPCDGIVGATGTVERGTVLQAKGMAYRLADLFADAAQAQPFEGGTYVTLRLTSAMYHRFHAPHDGRIEHVTHLDGDTFNVNPIALARIERLFCRNERALIQMRLVDGTAIALVPVAAILVAGIRLHALGARPLRQGRGPTELPCDAVVKKGEELGWFEHGSTIVVFVPPGFDVADGVVAGSQVRMGQALLRRRAIAADTAASRADASIAAC